MSIRINKLLFSFLVSSCYLAIVACGNNSWVNQASVQTSVMGRDIFGEIQFQIASDGLIFPSMSVPVFHESLRIGLLQLATDLAKGETQLQVQLNLSQIANLPRTRRSSGLLPNGVPIPVANINLDNLLTLTVGGTQSVVYADLNFRTRSGMVGVAIPFDQFDGLGASTNGMLNLFPAFRLENGLVGTAGVFTGNRNGQNGFAAFIDAQSLLNTGVTIQNVNPGPEQPRHRFLNLQTGSDEMKSNVRSQVEQMAQRRTRLTVAR